MKHIQNLQKFIHYYIYFERIRIFILQIYKSMVKLKIILFNGSYKYEFNQLNQKLINKDYFYTFLSSNTTYYKINF